jgi:hypothetical protein
MYKSIILGYSIIVIYPTVLHTLAVFFVCCVYFIVLVGIPIEIFFSWDGLESKGPLDKTLFFTLATLVASLVFRSLYFLYLYRQTRRM